MRLEYYSKDCRRIVNDAGELVGFADAFTNGKWQLNNVDGMPLSKIAFNSPGEAKKALQRRLAEST
jgi:hypothetical protein